MTADQWLAGGGILGLITALGVIGRLVLDAWRERRTVPVSERTTAVTDTATANAVILATLEAMAGENTRLRARVLHLERDNEAKATKISELTVQVADAQKQLQGIADELQRLKKTDDERK